MNNDHLKAAAAEALHDQQAERPEVQEVRPFPTVDLVEVAKAGIRPPKLLFGGLLYRGMLHSVAGPPDCGKSTLGYQAALDELRAGNTVVVLDEEGGREVVVEKFLALGAAPTDLEHLAYVEFPSRTWDAADRAGLWQLLREVRPSLVLVDSAGAFLAVAGQNENWAEHTIPFYKLLLAVAREHNTAAVVVDHVAKNETTGRYARGSGSKLQIADVAYMVDALVSFSRHQDGVLKLTVSKDRRGYLHRHHEVKVTVTDGAMTLEFRQAEATVPGDPRLVGLSPAAKKVFAVLPDVPDMASVQALGDLLKVQFGHSLRPSTIREALSALTVRQLADGEGGEGREKRWWKLS